MRYKKKPCLLFLYAFSLFLCSAGYGQATDTLTYGRITDTLVVRFGSNQSVLPGGAQAAVDSVLSLYGHGRGPVSVALYGHCDNIGSDHYNDSLSRARIQAVRNYLRLKFLFTEYPGYMNAYGKRRPLNDNGDERKRSLNRRVEIVLYSENGLPAASMKEDSPIANQLKPLTLADAFRDTATLTGRNITLRNVNFYGDRHIPLSHSYYELDNLLKLLIARPGLHIEIQGYVCCMPERMDGYDADTRTADLSVQRAKFVYTYLLQQGIKSDRMSYKGFGAGHKLYPVENNEQERESNRRVEIKILSWQ